MLLNFSNHPAWGNNADWSEEQIAAAESQFGGVVDYRDIDISIQPHNFPLIDPHLSDAEILAMAERYVQHILAKNITQVHIMGEFSFTYCLIRLLQKKHIDCYASTTERVEGRFQFIQFRKYPIIN